MKKVQTAVTSVMTIQEKALIQMYRRGELEEHTCIYDTGKALCDREGKRLRDEKNNKLYVKGEHLFFKVKAPSQYGVRRDPKQEPRAYKCCVSCRHMTYDEEDKDLIRKCQLTGNTVAKLMVCDKYDMKEFLKRL